MPGRVTSKALMLTVVALLLTPVWSLSFHNEFYRVFSGKRLRQNAAMLIIAGTLPFQVFLATRAIEQTCARKEPTDQWTHLFRVVMRGATLDVPPWRRG